MGLRGCARLCAGMGVWVWAGVCGCGRMFAGVCGCSRVFVGVHGCWREWAEGGMRGCAWVYACVWDEFSEFLLENRVPTSVDFNMYPIRIFLAIFLWTK